MLTDELKPSDNRLKLKNSQNILICPLEWGLGHAARMIPLAYELISRGNNVIFAAGSGHFRLIETELPGCRIINFPGFRPRYSRYLPQYVILVLQSPLLLFKIISEHFTLKRIIKEHSIDIVISDNRFGLWNRTVKTVYVTHQIRIPLPSRLRFLEAAGIYLHRLIISRYDHCFIPDIPGENNISGRLSHDVKLPCNAKYIGILSRMTLPGGHDMMVNEKDFPLVMLSGPEPQRGILEVMLKKMLSSRFRHVVMLQGLISPGKSKCVDKNISCHEFLPSAGIRHLFKNSSAIICRSGYSTIMDLVAAGVTALLIPTPGQTEQEYLADYLSEKGMFSCIRQSEVGSDIVIPAKRTYDNSGLLETSRDLMRKALGDLSDNPHDQAKAGKAQEKS